MKNHIREWGGYAEDDPKRVFSLPIEPSPLCKNRSKRIDLSSFRSPTMRSTRTLFTTKNAFEEVSNWPTGEVHQNRAYAAMVHNLDESIGLLLESL